MTIREIINRILAYHPNFDSSNTCDVIIGGNPEVTCTGILISIAPTIEVIMKAVEIGANFILVHEPTYYSGYDDQSEWLNGNEVYEEKKKLLQEKGIVIFRDHDHMHAHHPDGIFHYLLKELGWLEFAINDKQYGFSVKIPETTVGELIWHIKKVIGLKTIRYIGNCDARVSKIGFCGHLLPNEKTNWSNNEEILRWCDYDVIIPGETVEWTLPLYIRDAVFLGKAKAMILPGHFMQEEAGMRCAIEWLRPILGDEIKITFVSAGDMFQYM